MYFPKSVRLCEVGLRDGLQNEKTLLDAEQKLFLLRGLIDAGFPVIEVGSFMSPKAVPQMKDTDDLFKALGSPAGVELRALVANLRGVQRAIDCGCTKVKLNVSASRQHNLRNINRTPEESVASFAESAELARDNGLEVSGSISMPFASPWEGTTPVEDVDSIIEAYLKVGVSEISLSDASGMAMPAQVNALCRHVREKYPQATWWLHFHNTRGLGIANILAGMQAGFTQFDASFAGVGGCPFVPGAAGNVATEDVLHMCEEMGVATGIDLDKAMAVSRRVVSLIGHTTDSYLLRAGKSKDLIRELPTGQLKNQTQI